jgi:hypothetical protein
VDTRALWLRVCLCLGVQGGELGEEEEAGVGEESEDEEAVLERRVAENGTLSDGDSSDGEGKEKGEAEEQGAWKGVAGKGFEPDLGEVASQRPVSLN